MTTSCHQMSLDTLYSMREQSIGKTRESRVLYHIILRSFSFLSLAQPTTHGTMVFRKLASMRTGSTVVTWSATTHTTQSSTLREDRATNFVCTEEYLVCIHNIRYIRVKTFDSPSTLHPIDQIARDSWLLIISGNPRDAPQPIDSPLSALTGLMNHLTPPTPTGKQQKKRHRAHPTIKIY